MPSTWFQAVNPMFIFLLTPFLNMFWSWQSARGKEPASVAKMAVGCILLGCGFLPLMYITRGLGDTQKISFLWLVGSTLLYTVGELYLSPVGLSLVTESRAAAIGQHDDGHVVYVELFRQLSDRLFGDVL